MVNAAVVHASVTDTMQRVKEALDVWSAWMQQDDSHKLGYGRTVGFNSNNLSSWDDFERKVERNLAVNVQAILEGLEERMQCAVFYFHVAAVIKPRRTKIEDDYQDALIKIEIALRRRGLV